MKKNGFTFIEILVVITIIAILVVIGVISYGSVNKRSRDARRKSDIEQIRSALEMYRADNGYYPDGPSLSFAAVKDDTILTTALSSYMSSIPQDPKDNTEYAYQIKMTDSRGTPAHYYSYCLAAYTEAMGSDSNACTAETLPTSPKGELYTYGVKNP